MTKYLRGILFFGIVFCSFCFLEQVHAQNIVKLTGTDTSCVDQGTVFLSIWNFPMKGEDITEHSEMAQHLASFIPCVKFSKDEKNIARELLQKRLSSGADVHQTIEYVSSDLEREMKINTEARVIFGIVSEYFDNLSLYLFEKERGSKLKHIKLTMKRDAWGQAIGKLRPHLEKSESGFMNYLDQSNQNLKVEVNVSEHPNDRTLSRLESEVKSTIRSRFRNPLPPNFWERRSFFVLAKEQENADAKVMVHLEMEGTKIYTRIEVFQNLTNSRSTWLEGTLANLPEFEDEVYKTIRDMLSDVMKIYDYSANLGIEFYRTRDTQGKLFSLSIKHNRGELAATLRIQAGALALADTCKGNPFLIGTSILPGWQFYQTERSSFDGGILLGVGLLDAAFVDSKSNKCLESASVNTYAQMQTGPFIQANYTTAKRLSLLARTSYEFSGLTNISGTNTNETFRKRHGFLLFLGMGIAF